MAAREHQVEIDKIDITLKSIEQVLNLPKLIENAASLEEQASAPNLWDDPQAAQVVTSKLSRAQSTINKINGIRSRLNDLPIMIEIANGETDKTSAFKDIDKELDDLTQVIKDLEVQTLLSGEYDERDALITIRSEAGGAPRDSRRGRGGAAAGAGAASRRVPRRGAGEARARLGGDRAAPEAQLQGVHRRRGDRGARATARGGGRAPRGDRAAHRREARGAAGVRAGGGRAAR